MSALTRGFAALAAVTVAAALAVATPLSAQARPSHGYAPGHPETWSAEVRPGATLVHDVPAATFDGLAVLQLTVTGTADTPITAAFTASQATFALSADGGGGVVLRLAFPASASGVYDVTVLEAGSERSSVGTVTVVGGAPAAAAADPAPAATRLAATGSQVDPASAWGGAGAVIAGALIVLIVSWRRARARRPR